jgi:hypothetical protein
MEPSGAKNEEVVAFLVETLERADASLDPEGLLVTATSRGLQIEPHHIRAAFERLQQRWQGELKDDALDQVSGGASDDRNRRAMDTSAFQSFDQKSNQTLNLLTSVVKTLGEMRGIGAGSRSGL